MNLGQLSMLLRAEYLVDVQSITSVRGMPFGAEEMENVLLTALAEIGESPEHELTHELQETS